MTKQWRFILYVIIIGCIFNFLWEYWHMPFFNFPPFIEQMDLSRTTFSIVGMVNATLTTLLISFIIKKLHQEQTWQSNWNSRKVFETAFLGGLCITVYEKLALTTGAWSYADTMPITPILNISLTGLVQYLIIPLLTLYISSKLIHENNF